MPETSPASSIFMRTGAIPERSSHPSWRNWQRNTKEKSTSTRSTLRRNRNLPRCSTSAASRRFFLCPRMENPDVHGSFAQRKFRPGDQGCSPGSRADRFLSGTWDEFKSVGGCNRIIEETSGFSRTGRIALQPDPLPEQCSEKMCSARRDGMQAFTPIGQRAGSGKDE